MTNPTINRRTFLARLSAFLALPAGLAGLLGRRKAEKPVSAIFTVDGVRMTREEADVLCSDGEYHSLVIDWNV